MTTEELHTRLAGIEKELDEDRKHRHEHNSQIASVIDSVRIDQADDRGRLKRLETEMLSMARSVSDLVGAIKGTMGFDGIVKMIKDQSVEIAVLNSWRISLKGWMAGWISAAAISSGLVFAIISKYVL